MRNRALRRDPITVDEVLDALSLLLRSRLMLRRHRRRWRRRRHLRGERARLLVHRRVLASARRRAMASQMPDLTSSDVFDVPVPRRSLTPASDPATSTTQCA
jgi:hypothetical protein